MANLNPSIRFNDGKCLEAMRFYKDALGGGEVTYMTLGESPMGAEATESNKNLVMHAEFSKKDMTFYASDMMRDKAVIGDNVGIALNCDSEEEITTIFDKLSVGGDIFMKPEMQFWGGMYGMVTDKYGVEWALNYQKEKPDQSKSHKLA